MNAKAPPRPPLSLGDIFTGATSLPGIHRIRLWRGIGLPFSIIIASAVLVAVGGHARDPYARALLGAVIFCCTSEMAVVIHRLVLLPMDSSSRGPMRLRLQWLAKVVLATLGLWVIFVAVGLGVGYVLRAVFGAMNISIPPFWLQTLAAAAAVWVIARLCLVTPGLVLDRPNSWTTAWQVSRGNGWRLAAVLALMPWLIILLVQTLWPRGVDRLQFVLIIVMMALLSIFELFALSLSYRELTAPGPRPSDPPG
jgi:hypothetical protein